MRARPVGRAAALAVGLVLAGCPGGVAHAQARPAAACRAVEVPAPSVRPPVRLPEILSVRMCVPATGAVPRRVQLLVHGAVTDHRYWNLPDRDGSGRNSWEAAALAAGWATAAVDRLGSGASTHPPGVAVTLDANVAALHALAQALRSGGVPTARGMLRAVRVVFVGHSMGSGIVALAASRFPDADAVILTGYSHHGPEPYAPLAFTAALQPAAWDPHFAGLDPGYLTTRPGARGFLFDPGTDVDPRLVAVDEATKGTVTAGELAGGGVAQQTVLRGVTVPVLLLTGGLDALFCSQTPGDLGADCSSGRALAAEERPWFPQAPSVTAVIVPGVGHLLNAFRAAPAAFAAAMTWLAPTR